MQVTGEVSATDWRRALQKDKAGKVTKAFGNLVAIFEGHWNGVLAFNEFEQRVVIMKVPPSMAPCYRGGKQFTGPWTEEHTAMAKHWVEDNYKLPFSLAEVRAAVGAAATSHRYHPVREWLEGLHWDGKPRLDGWLVRHGGAKGKVAEVAFAKWLIAAVARTYSPGCQADHVLILEGEQGVGKTSFFRLLGGDFDSSPGNWYAALDTDLGSKDAVQALFAKLIIELPELSSIKKSADIERVKSFVTTKVDHIRRAYDRDSRDFPRQCVLGGSTNASEWLQEVDRRWWPVRVGAVDLERLKAERGQLWGEAVARYKSGEKWLIDDPEIWAELREEVEGRRVEDVWEEKVERFLRTARRSEVTIVSLLQTVYGHSPGDITRSQEMRMGSVLRQLGWHRERIMVDGKRRYRYLPPEGWYGVAAEPAPAVVVPLFPSEVGE